MIIVNQIKCFAKRFGGRNRQRGVAMPLVVAGMAAMLVIAGLAIDSSHAYVNKTRLQNTTDAAALAALSLPISRLIVW